MKLGVVGAVFCAAALAGPAHADVETLIRAVSELPEGFHKADGRGRRGYMEWGFLSTTTHRAVAVQVGLPDSDRGLLLY